MDFETHRLAAFARYVDDRRALAALMALRPRKTVTVTRSETAILARKERIDKTEAIYSDFRTAYVAFRAL